MNWKKLGKLALVLALIMAMFSSSLYVARAVENGDNDHNERPFGDNTSPQEIITDEVDDSTIINGDGGGTGSSGHRHDWKYMCIWWDITNEGEMIADARYECKDCPEPNTDVGVRIEEVRAVVEKIGNRKYSATVSAADSLDGEKHTMTYKGNDKWEFDGFNWGRSYDESVFAFAHYSFTPEVGYAGYEYKLSQVLADVTEENGVYTATVSANQSLDKMMHKEVYPHTHKWVFDRFEWDEIKAYALYHCDDEDGVCVDKREIEATVDRITGRTIRYRATVTSAQSPDRKEHVEIIRPSRTTHEWIYDGIEWDLSEYDCVNETGEKAKAVYHCRLHRSEHCEAEATITGRVTMSVMGFNVGISSTDSPDGKEHGKTVLLEFYPFKGAIFDGFEWDTSDGIKAYAVYRLEFGYFKGQQLRYPATVTRVPGTVAPMYKAEVPAIYTLDDEAHSATKIIINPPTPPVIPDPQPVTPIVGPIEKREINPDLIIGPIGELTPANP